MDLNELVNNPDKIKDLINVLQALLPKDSDPIQSQESEEEFVDPIKTRGSKKFSKQRPESNKFLSMPEKDMFKQDSEIDKLLNKHPPISRNRPTATNVDAVCRVCGKKESVSSALVGESPSRYKCNTCSTSAG
jgi:hypothetical protein